MGNCLDGIEAHKDVSILFEFENMALRTKTVSDETKEDSPYGHRNTCTLEDLALYMYTDSLDIATHMLPSFCDLDNLVESIDECSSDEIVGSIHYTTRLVDNA